jgi:hypothetical protein
MGHPAARKERRVLESLHLARGRTLTDRLRIAAGLVVPAVLVARKLM